MQYVFKGGHLDANFQRLWYAMFWALTMVLWCRKCRHRPNIDDYKTVNMNSGRTTDSSPSETYEKPQVEISKVGATTFTPLIIVQEAAKRALVGTTMASKLRTKNNCQLLTDPPAPSSVYMGVVGQKNQVCSSRLFPITPELISLNCLHFQPILAC